MTPEQPDDGSGASVMASVDLTAPVVIPNVGDAADGRSQGRRAERRWRELRRRKRNRRKVYLIVGAVWVGLIAWSFIGTLNASNRANTAVGALAAQGLAAADADDLRAVAAELETAKARLNDPWVRPLEFVPLLGRQIRAARTIDESALEAVEAGADAILVLEQARQSTNQIELLGLAKTELSIARARLASTVLPSSTLLVPPLAAARDRLGEQLVEIDRELARFEAVASAFGSLISSDVTYLLAAANTSEMGAGTGMMLSLGLLEVADGSAVVGHIDTILNLEGRPSGVEIPQELRDRWFSLDPGHLFQYVSHLTPRVDVSGRIIAEMWESLDQPAVDGVIIINPVALQILLETSDSDTVEIGEDTYPVDVIGRFFGRLQYQLYEDSAERRELLAPIAAQAFSAVFEKVDDPQLLVDAVYEAVEGRHMMAWARDPAQQERWQNLGMAGTLRSDSLMLGVLNAGGNKLDAFIEIDSTVTWRSTAEGTTVVVDIEIRNTATGAEVDYIAGPNRRSAAAGEYLGHFTVNLPAGATRAEMTGSSPTNAAGPDGATHQLVHILKLAPGAAADYHLEFDLPALFETLTIEPSGRLPGIQWMVNGIELPDRRRTVELTTS